MDITILALYKGRSFSEVELKCTTSKPSVIKKVEKILKKEGELKSE